MPTALTITLSFTADGEIECLPVASWGEPLAGVREGQFVGTDGEGRTCPVRRTRRPLVVGVSGVTVGANERSLVVAMEA